MNDALKDLIGETITAIDVAEDKSTLTFTFEQRKGQYRFWHGQDCCEQVLIDDIAGDLEDLIGSPLLHVEEAVSSVNPEGVKPDYQDSFTWTFYKFATIKGSVTIRWYGESNGYYSESVDHGWVNLK